MTVAFEFVADNDALRVYLPMDKTVFTVRLHINPIAIIEVIGLFLPADAGGVRVRISDQFPRILNETPYPRSGIFLDGSNIMEASD